MLGDHILSGLETNRRFQDKAASIDEQLNDARSKIDWERRNAAESDIVLWVNTYCIGAFLDETPPPLGEQIIREMWQAIQDSRPYLIEQARGSGKTSYIESVVTAAIAQGKRKFPLLIGENESSSQNLLTDIFRIVMDDGPFSQDYPDLCLPFQLCNGSFRRRQTYKGVMTDIVKNASRLVFARITNDDGTETPYYGEEIDDSKLSWGINYNELIAPIVKLLQEQQMEIDSLKSEIEHLKQM